MISVLPAQSSGCQEKLPFTAHQTVLGDQQSARDVPFFDGSCPTEAFRKIFKVQLSRLTNMEAHRSAKLPQSRLCDLLKLERNSGREESHLTCHVSRYFNNIYFHPGRETPPIHTSVCAYLISLILEPSLSVDVSATSQYRSKLVPNGHRRSRSYEAARHDTVSMSCDMGSS